MKTNRKGLRLKIITGSSNISSLGLWIKLTAKLTLRRCPPLKTVKKTSMIKQILWDMAFTWKADRLIAYCGQYFLMLFFIKLNFHFLNQSLSLFQKIAGVKYSLHKL